MNPSVKLAEQMNMKKFALESMFSSLNESIMLIVDHFLYLNNLLLTFQKDFKQKEYQRNGMLALFDDGEAMSSANFITLKQSNQVLKQFHSLNTTLMVLVTSIKNL